MTESSWKDSLHEAALSDWLEEKLSGSYFRLVKTIEGKAEINKRTQSRLVFAGVALRLEPRAAGSGYQKTVALKNQDIADFDQEQCIAAAFTGAIDALFTQHFHPIRDVEIMLTGFYYDKPQSARVAFWEAGRDAVRTALHHGGGVGMTENKGMFELVSRG